MQSGNISNSTWYIEHKSNDGTFIEPVMGWTGGRDMLASEVRLKFPDRDSAIRYATNAGLQYEIYEPKIIQQSIRSYADIFNIS